LVNSIGLQNEDWTQLTDNIIEYIIENYTNEAGVRDIKRYIEKIFLTLNLDKIYQREIKEPIKESIKESENKKGVFANLKSYNKDSLKVKIESNNNNNDINATNKEVKINRYTSGGKISNFNFIKKVDKHLVNKNYSLSFADFKKMKNKNI